MLDRPQIVTTETQPAAVIRLTIPRADIQRVMGPAIGEVMGAIAAQGVAPAGPVFSHHFRMDPDVLDFEVGVPVTRPAARRRHGPCESQRVAGRHGRADGLPGPL
jgi:hypothetical protein